MVGIVSSSYYREPSGGKKGNKPSKETFHNTKGCIPRYRHRFGKEDSRA